MGKNIQDKQTRVYIYLAALFPIDVLNKETISQINNAGIMRNQVPIFLIYLRLLILVAVLVTQMIILAIWMEITKVDVV